MHFEAPLPPDMRELWQTVAGADPSLPLENSFVPRIDTAFGTAVERVDFRAPASACRRINAWVEERTRQRIKDIVPEGKPSPDTRLVLARDEIVELIVETVCARRKTTRIAGADFPHEVVRSRFLKLDSSHIEFVMECLHNNTTEVRNMKQYLLTVLFNTPTTMNNHYTAQVNHDMHAGGW